VPLYKVSLHLFENRFYHYRRHLRSHNSLQMALRSKVEEIFRYILDLVGTGVKHGHVFWLVVPLDFSLLLG
jgi:hypothetical protein